MNVITDVLVAVTGTLIAALIASEVNGWAPRIVARFIKIAVSILPVDLKVRYDEEWACAHHDIPTIFSQLVYAIGLIAAATSMRLSRARRRNLLLSPVTMIRSGGVIVIYIAMSGARSRFINRLVIWFGFGVVIALGVLLVPLQVSGQRHKLSRINAEISKEQSELNRLKEEYRLLVRKKTQEAASPLHFIEH